MPLAAAARRPAGRASTLPAQVLAAATEGAVERGTLAVGADADVVVLDPAAYSDCATYEDGTRTSKGVRHLLVSGTPLIAHKSLDTSARPGRPVRA